MVKYKQADSFEIKEETTHTFRMSWLRLYSAMTSAGTLLLLIAYGLSLMAGEPPGALELTIALGGYCFVLLLSVLMVRSYPIYLSASGVSSFNFWGKRQMVTWEEIASVKTSRLAGVPWILVYSRSTKSALWLPAFFANRGDFERMLAQLAPADCPLLGCGEGNGKAHLAHVRRTPKRPFVR